MSPISEANLYQNTQAIPAGPSGRLACLRIPDLMPGQEGVEQVQRMTCAPDASEIGIIS